MSCWRLSCFCRACCCWYSCYCWSPCVPVLAGFLLLQELLLAGTNVLASLLLLTSLLLASLQSLVLLLTSYFRWYSISAIAGVPSAIYVCATLLSLLLSTMSV